MPNTVQGIHHITAITTDAQHNYDFYTRVLGFHLLKQTVNFDEPSTRHLYYGNELGRPGTLLSFFVYPMLAKGRLGKGQVSAIGLSVPKDSLPFWKKRLKTKGISTNEKENHFGEQGLYFCDPDGLPLVMVEAEKDHRPPISGASIKEKHAIRGIYNVELVIEGAEDTLHTLKQYLHYAFLKDAQNRARFSASQKPGDFLDLCCQPDRLQGELGAGTLHHLAFKVPSAKELEALHGTLTEAGINVSPILDRKYYSAFYFRELEGILLKIATVPPGFTRDEPLSELGSSLKLPQYLEASRKDLEKTLPRFTIPKEK